MKRLLIATMVTVCLSIPMSVPAQKVGGGDLTFIPKDARPVVFSHNRHVSDKGLKCVDCHYKIFQMALGSYEMHMEDLTKGSFCGKCHNGRSTFGVKNKEDCIRCHR